MARRLPASPMAFRFSGSASNSATAEANAAAFRGGTSRPVSPSTTASGFPPTSHATTGSPAAIASRIALENPSSREGWTKRSEARRRSGTSVRLPTKRTDPSIPRSRTRALVASIVPESLPTSRKMTFGNAGTTRAAASTSSSCPLYG